MPVVLASKSKHRNKKLDDNAELIQTSLKRFKITSEAEAEARKFGLEDLEFSIGTGQWDAAVKANREIDGKPCLTINRAPTFVRQLTGEERQHRPAMIVNPVGEGSDEDTAKICQGVLRHIEVCSNADVVYDSAYDWMLRTGWANWRILSDYVDETSFAQELRIVGIENPFSVYMSPFRRPDGTDPLWCHIVQDLSKDEYLEKYPDSSLAKLNFPTNMGNPEPTWMVKDGVRIAEYWWLELQHQMLYRLKDGTVKLADQATDEEKASAIDKRETVTRAVNCVKHNAVEVLEHYQWAGRYIPVVELSGVRLNVNGKVFRAGIIRDYRDAQRIYDFMVTREVEQVDLYSKDPIWLAEGNQNHEEEYRQMNRKNYPYMWFKAYDENGRQLPAPQRMGRETPIAAMTSLVQQADYDMKAVMGIYGPGPGETAQPNESAFAVLTRQNQTETGSVNWSDNLNRAISWQGQILLDAFPKYLDSARVQRIIDPDDSVRHAVVYNSNYSDEGEASALLDGEALKKVYDVGVGKYDVALSSGPQYRTARQEAFRAIGALVTANPELFPIIGDVWIKYADWPGAHVLADRIKKALPPNLQDTDSDDPKAKVAALQAQLGQLQQQHGQAMQLLQKANGIIQGKQVEQQGKAQIATIQAQSEQMIAQMKLEVQQAIEKMQLAKETFETLHGSAHDLAMQKDEHAHQRQIAQETAAAARLTQHNQQAHEVGMAAMNQANQSQQQEGVQ